MITCFGIRNNRFLEVKYFCSYWLSVHLQSDADVVVLVDDDSDILKIFKDYLMARGYVVHAFSSTVSAFEHIKYDPTACDALITDIRMPEMNGLQLATKVKELNSNIKIILMTAFDFIMSEREAFAKSTPISGVLELPFSLERVDELLKSLKAEKPQHLPAQ